jgi:NADPH:quinone reductase
MLAWQLSKLGSLDHLSFDNIADPSLGEGEVVLKLAYAALNPADRYLAEGAYPARPSFPHVLGRDGVGTVIAVGANVSGIKPGDVKMIMRGETGVTKPGTFAERVAVPADDLIDVPAGWSLEQAAGATLVYLTAYQAITQWDCLGTDLPSDCVTLITGASGGVGVAATQLAKAMGHFVVGLSRSEEKSKTLREIGADLTLDPTDPTWPKKLSRKVNLVIENIGGSGFNDLLNVMDMNGRISVIGRLAGPVPSFNTASLFFRRLRIGGVAVGTYSRPDALDAWKNVLGLLAKTNQKPLVDQVFALKDLRAAFDRLAAGPMGKVLVKP